MRCVLACVCDCNACLPAWGLLAWGENTLFETRRTWEYTCTIATILLHAVVAPLLLSFARVLHCCCTHAVVVLHSRCTCVARVLHCCCTPEALTSHSRCTCVALMLYPRRNVVALYYRITVAFMLHMCRTRAAWLLHYIVVLRCIHVAFLLHLRCAHVAFMLHSCCTHSTLMLHLRTTTIRLPPTQTTQTTQQHNNTNNTNNKQAHVGAVLRQRLHEGVDSYPCTGWGTVMLILLMFACFACR